MTRHLVERKAFDGDPLVFLDVGAAGGIPAEWQVFGDQMRVYCFEPNEAECARLASLAPANITYLPVAVGRSTGDATLYVSKLSLSTGLYKTDMAYFSRFVNRDNGVVIGEQSVKVQSLDDVAAAYGIAAVDFLKLDAEGAELDILVGGEKLVRSAVGLVSEVRLHSEINGSPAFSTLDQYVCRQDFRLYNLELNHHSRMSLPYRQLGDYRTATGDRFYAYTEHGQLQDGDALYFRDLVGAEADPVKVLKTCALMEVYNLADCSAELIQANRARLSPAVDCDHLLDLLTSGIPGGGPSYKDYIASYFAPAGTSGGESRVPPASLIQRLLRLVTGRG